MLFLIRCSTEASQTHNQKVTPYPTDIKGQAFPGASRIQMVAFHFCVCFRDSQPFKAIVYNFHIHFYTVCQPAEIKKNFSLGSSTHCSSNEKRLNPAALTGRFRSFGCQTSHAPHVGPGLWHTPRAEPSRLQQAAARVAAGLAFPRPSRADRRWTTPGGSTGPEPGRRGAERRYLGRTERACPRREGAQARPSGTRGGSGHPAAKEAPLLTCSGGEGSPGGAERQGPRRPLSQPPAAPHSKLGTQRCAATSRAAMSASCHPGDEAAPSGRAASPLPANQRRPARSAEGGWVDVAARQRPLGERCRAVL